MSMVPEPTPGPTLVSGSDLIDEIRRHIRTLEAVTRNGDGSMVLRGRDAKVSNASAAVLAKDLKKALGELTELAGGLGD